MLLKPIKNACREVSSKMRRSSYPFNTLVVATLVFSVIITAVPRAAFGQKKTAPVEATPAPVREEFKFDKVDLELLEQVELKNYKKWGTPGIRAQLLNIKNQKHRLDSGPLDSRCECYTCRHYTRAYLRHLASAGEMLGGQLATLHNLHFYLDTMRRIRKAIEFGTFEEFRRSFLETYSRRHTDSLS